MRRAEERAVFLGLLERDSDGAVTMTDKGEDYFLECVLSPPTIH